MKKMNKDVPIETILKHALIENGKLKSEVAYLEDKVKRQEMAINDFKKWQSKVVERNYMYWIAAAKDFVKADEFDQKECTELLKFFQAYDAYKSMVDALKRERDRVVERYKKIHKRFAPTSEDVVNPLELIQS